MNGNIDMGPMVRHPASALLSQAASCLRAPAWILAAALHFSAPYAIAQEAPGGWDANVGTGGTTTIMRQQPEADAPQVGQVRLVALLTADGQQIDKGLVWHVFGTPTEGAGNSRLLETLREPSPLLNLEPGEYVVNAAFGRAHLTRKITIDGSKAAAVEQFVINAGGLRVSAFIDGSPAPPNSVTYTIQSDRDQSDQRQTVMADAKPDLIIRLNAGIYHIVSTYGNANAVVESDVTVEAGKLTEAQITHTAAKTEFRLVTRQGGEAVSDTQWTIRTKDGRVVKKSMGALPTHLLAPGAYAAIARSKGKSYTREFEVTGGQSGVVEVVMDASVAP